MIQKYLYEETAFYHQENADAFQWPVFNICPMIWVTRNITTTFEQNEARIQQTLLSFTAALFPEGSSPDNPA